jgi:hypothetical protein
MHVYDLATITEAEAERIAGETALFRVALANDAWDCAGFQTYECANCGRH